MSEKDKESQDNKVDISSSKGSDSGGSILAGKQIMWVEDDVFLSEIIAKKCKSKKCDLIHVTNGDDTFKTLEDQKPDVIVLDILLPGMNGYEILEKLKKNPDTVSIPVMILSNFGQKDEINKGLALGAEKYLIKATLTLDEILAEVADILANKK